MRAGHAEERSRSRIPLPEAGCPQLILTFSNRAGLMLLTHPYLRWNVLCLSGTPTLPEGVCTHFVRVCAYKRMCL